MIPNFSNILVVICLLDFPNKNISAFTDGSCLNNPGPCGAGAIVFVEEETTELKQPVCKRESILLEINSNQNSIRIQ
jgi:hypothetical protein